jgi:hypothetical protein
MNYCDKHRVGFDSQFCPYCVAEETQLLLSQAIAVARYLNQRPPYIA